MSWNEIAAVAGPVAGTLGVLAAHAGRLAAHWINTRFWRHALDNHGPDGLAAAARATHGVEAIQAHQAVPPDHPRARHRRRR